jgi:hypothetical protein
MAFAIVLLRGSCANLALYRTLQRHRRKLNDLKPKLWNHLHPHGHLPVVIEIRKAERKEKSPLMVGRRRKAEKRLWASPKGSTTSPLTGRLDGLPF